MQTTRQRRRAASNNRENPNQNKCGLAIAQALGVDDKVRYLHTIRDLKRAASHYFSVRSRATALGLKKGKRTTVGSMRRHCALQGARWFLVWTPLHVLLLNAKGTTIIDADPRKRDSRPVLGVWGLFPK
jgi:hypothetical protein